METLTVRNALVGLLALFALILLAGSLLTLLVGTLLFIWNVGDDGMNMSIYFRVGATAVVGLFVSIVLIGLAVMLVDKK